MLAGCKAVKQTVEVPVYVHDTTYVAKEVHDSTFIDRWHTEYQKGDTIFITNEVTKTVTKILTDTAYKYIEKPVIGNSRGKEAFIMVAEDVCVDRGFVFDRNCAVAGVEIQETNL